MDWRSFSRLCFLGAASLRQFVQRQARTASSGRLDQVEIISGRNAFPALPGEDRRVWQPQIAGQFLPARPDVRDGFHVSYDTHGAYYSQYAYCLLHVAACVFTLRPSKRGGK